MYLLPNAPEMATVETNSEVLSRSKYIGSNAMGAKVEVSSTQSESYGFAVDPRAWFFDEAESRSSSQQVQLGIPAPVGLAVSLKSKIRVALIGKLDNPWMAKDVLSHDPTIDNPYELLEGQHFLVITPSELVVYREDTGEVIKRVDESVFEQKHSLALNLKIECKSIGSLMAIVDGKDDSDVCSDHKTLRANRSIALRTTDQTVISGWTFLLNGQPYEPKWIKDEPTTSRSGYLESSSALIQAP